MFSRLWCKLFGHRESLLAMCFPEFIGKCTRCGEKYLDIEVEHAP